MVLLSRLVLPSTGVAFVTATLAIVVVILASTSARAIMRACCVAVFRTCPLCRPGRALKVQTRGLNDPKSTVQASLLIVGLGNPGKAYAGTRHNIGFEVVDSFSQSHGLLWEKKLKHKALVGHGKVGPTSVILCKPMAFINVSGESVAPLVREYRISLQRILVVHDDLDSEFGAVKLKAKGGHGGHNGMRSIIACLHGQKDFPRLKLGIGRPASGGAAGHVLSPFDPQEQQAKGAVVSDAVAALDAICMLGTDMALSGMRV